MMRRFSPSPALIAIATSLVAFAGLAFLLPFTLATPSALAAPAQASQSVDINGSVTDPPFSPQRVTIAPGDFVTWTNRDFSSHTATADDGSWTTGDLANGRAGGRQFLQVGIFTYHCAIHPNMTGTVVVTTTAQATATAVPTGSATAVPTGSATAAPTGSATAAPTGSATASPTVSPTASATVSPTVGPGASPRVTITVPSNGDNLLGTSVTARYTATGVTIVPADGTHTDATGHFHLFVDQPISLTADGGFARGPGIFHTVASSQLITGLVPGPHTITLTLGHGDHTPFTPPVVYSATFTTALVSSQVFLPAVFRSKESGW